MLILASLGSWLPFAIVGLVRQKKRRRKQTLNFFFHFLVYYPLFICIYITISEKTKSRLSRDIYLFVIIDYCLIYREFIAYRCYARFVYEISKWNF